MLHALHHILLDGLLLVEWRILWQVADGVARAPDHVALILLIQSCNDLHQRGLTCTVQSDDTDLGAIEETQVDVLEHLLLVLLDGLAHSDHREDDFLVVDCCHNDNVG